MSNFITLLKRRIRTFRVLASAGGDALLLETGDRILLETGDAILMETG